MARFAPWLSAAALAIATLANGNFADAQSDTPAAREARLTLRAIEKKYGSRPGWGEWSGRLGFKDIEYELRAGDSAEPETLAATAAQLRGRRDRLSPRSVAAACWRSGKTRPRAWSYSAGRLAGRLPSAGGELCAGHFAGRARRPAATLRSFGGARAADAFAGQLARCLASVLVVADNPLAGQQRHARRGVARSPGSTLAGRNLGVGCARTDRSLAGGAELHSAVSRLPGQRNGQTARGRLERIGPAARVESRNRRRPIRRKSRHCSTSANDWARPRR